VFWAVDEGWNNFEINFFTRDNGISFTATRKWHERVFAIQSTPANRRRSVFIFLLSMWTQIK